jgi:hypothetical protein
LDCISHSVLLAPQLAYRSVSSRRLLLFCAIAWPSFVLHRRRTIHHHVARHQLSQHCFTDGQARDILACDRILQRLSSSRCLEDLLESKKTWDERGENKLQDAMSDSAPPEQPAGEPQPSPLPPAESNLTSAASESTAAVDSSTADQPAAEQTPAAVAADSTQPTNGTSTDAGAPGSESTPAPELTTAMASDSQSEPDNRPAVLIIGGLGMH